MKKDVQKAVNLFIAYFDTQSEAVFERLTGQLSAEPEWLFKFLKLTLFESRLNYSNQSQPTGETSESSNTGSSSESHRKIFKLCTNAAYQERYLELVAQLEPATILAVLDVLQECSEIQALTICRKYGVKEGEAYVYEKTKQYRKAFTLLLEDFKGTVNESIQYTFNNLNASQKVTTTSSTELNANFFSAIDGKFTRLLDFCKRSFGRHTGSVNDKEAASRQQSFCLSTLEFLIETRATLNGIFAMRDEEDSGPLLPQYLHLLADPSKRPQIEKLIANYNDRFRLLFEKLVSVMLLHFSLLDLFDFIVKKVLGGGGDNKSKGAAAGHDNLYDVREMLLCILENYHYEKSLLELTNNMLCGEHHQLTSKFQAANVRSKNVRQTVCGLCLRSTLADGAILLYTCTHLFHESCIAREQKKVSTTSSNQQQLCPLCNGHLVIDNDDDQVSSESKKLEGGEDEEELASVEQSSSRMSNGKQQEQLSLNETQYRALNYFHHNRFGASRGFRVPK